MKSLLKDAVTLFYSISYSIQFFMENDVLRIPRIHLEHIEVENKRLSLKKIAVSFDGLPWAFKSAMKLRGNCKVDLTHCYHLG